MLDKKVLEGIANGNLVRDLDERDSESEFECPRCFSSYFGASGLGPEKDYYCHDEFNRGCNWHGTFEKCFVHTYEKSTLAAELLIAYKRIEELEGK